jgi:hypothetical protein
MLPSHREKPESFRRTWAVTVNLKTAKALCLKVSDDLLSLADEVIE